MRTARIGLLLATLVFPMATYSAEEFPNSTERLSALGVAELKAMAESGGKVQRSGNVLTVATKAKKLTFIDDDVPSPSKETPPISYLYMGFYPEIQYYLVARTQYYEDTDYLFISDSSARTVVMPDAPHISPLRKHVVAVLGSEMAGTEIVIWGIEGGKLMEQYRSKVPHKKYFIPTFKGWDGDNKVDIIADEYSKDRSLCPIVAVSYVLKKVGITWKLETNPAKPVPVCSGNG